MRSFISSLVAAAALLSGTSLFSEAAPGVSHHELESRGGGSRHHVWEPKNRGYYYGGYPHYDYPRHGDGSGYNDIARGSTCNRPSNRACWSRGFDLNTDYDSKTPDTGVTRHYTLVLSEQTNWVGPDGELKSLIMLINGTAPGPTLVADWGDVVSVKVINNLVTNGTSMHWHGIRMQNNNLNDGVNGVTECPTPPGYTKTYTFKAQQYGTTWYHSHFSAQYGNGVYGALVINGPASLPYEIDLGPFPVGDYYYNTADNLVEYTKDHGPPDSDNVLFNGTNIHPVTGAGAYANVTLTPGKRHRLRLINPSVENHFVLSLVDHDITIIAADLVPVQAQTVKELFMAPGQRYDVTIDANKKVGNYWFNATFVSNKQCGYSQNEYPAAVFRYEGAPKTLPTDPGSNSTEITTCSDLDNLTPVHAWNPPTSNYKYTNSSTIPITLFVSPTTPLFTWKVNGSAVDVNWNKPVDQYIFEGNTSYPTSDNIVAVNGSESWAFWLIENDPNIGVPHPMHLHGHDFVVLARSDVNVDKPPAFDASSVYLRSQNPVRRDVTMLPSLGWIVIGFKTDNPGTWVMHCHIAWHVSNGLSVSFIERPEDFVKGVSAADKASFDENCAAWNAYYPANDPFKKTDSGLRIRSRPIRRTPDLEALASRAWA